MSVCVCLTVFNVLVEREPNRWQSTERRKMDRIQAAAIILMLGTHVWSIISYDTPFSGLKPFLFPRFIAPWCTNEKMPHDIISASIHLYGFCLSSALTVSQRPISENIQVIRLIFQKHANFSLVVSGGLHSSSSLYLWEISRITTKHLRRCSYIFSSAEYLKKQSTSVTVILFLLEYCHCSYLRWDNKCDYWVCVFLLACVYIMKSQFKQLFSTMTGWEFRLNHGRFDQIWGIEESKQMCCAHKLHVFAWMWKYGPKISWGCIQTI